MYKPIRMLSTSMDRRSFIASLAAVSAGGAAGCIQPDGGGDVSMESTETESPTPTATATEAAGTERPARQEYPDYNWEVLEEAEPEATTEVTLRNTAFDPLIAAVPTGATVTFTNNDSFGHTVTVPALDVDRELGGDESTTVTVEQAGTFDYVCELHPPSMLGRLVVTEETPTDSPTDTSTDSPTDSPTDRPTPTPTDSPTPTPTPSPTETEDDGGYY
jgi:plastocyanin